jgi:sRNA-binding carbon storage regulator CsrA
MGRLVISRRCRERIIFIDNRSGRKIGKAMVVDSIGAVKLAFEFPEWVTILREELIDIDPPAGHNPVKP